MKKDYLIKKWLSNDLSEQELEDFKQFEDYDLHVRISENAKNFKAPDILTPDDFETLKQKIAAKPDKSVKQSWLSPLLKIASVLLIAFGIYFTFFSNNLTRIESLRSEKITAVLPDNSEVVLNAVSEISYDEKKWNEKRVVNLKGEAFFKVAKGSVFDVLTPNSGKVSVLGTQFNVKNREEYFEVVCYEGSVSVDYKGTSKKLIPGNSYSIRNGEITIDTIKDTRPSWIENISDFEQVPFTEVVLEFQRQYEVTVDIESINADRLFTGGFVHGDLDAAIKSIAMPLNLTYNIQSPSKIILKNSE